MKTLRGRGVYKVLDVPCFDEISTIFIVCTDADFDHKAKHSLLAWNLLPSGKNVITLLTYYLLALFSASTFLLYSLKTSFKSQQRFAIQDVFPVCLLGH